MSQKVKHSSLLIIWPEIYNIYKLHNISESISLNFMLILKMQD